MCAKRVGRSVSQAPTHAGSPVRPAERAFGICWTAVLMTHVDAVLLGSRLLPRFGCGRVRPSLGRGRGDHLARLGGNLEGERQLCGMGSVVLHVCDSTVMSTDVVTGAVGAWASRARTREGPAQRRHALELRQMRRYRIRVILLKRRIVLYRQRVAYNN